MSLHLQRARRQRSSDLVLHCFYCLWFSIPGRERRCIFVFVNSIMFNPNMKLTYLLPILFFISDAQTIAPGGSTATISSCIVFIVFGLASWKGKVMYFCFAGLNSIQAKHETNLSPAHYFSFSTHRAPRQAAVQQRSCVALFLLPLV